MPLALLIFFAVLALLIISALLVVLFTLVIRFNPAVVGGEVPWRRAVLISLALVGFVLLLNTLFVVVVALLLGI